MADRYWVGGTANWDGTAGTKWATTSGGAGGASVPTSADDVFFDAASTGTCTISSGNTGAKSINCTGFTGTLAGNIAITVSGSVTFSAGMTVTYTGGWTFNASATITSAGKTISGAGGGVTVNGNAITVQLADALNIGLGRLTLTRGTFTTNGYNITAADIVNNISFVQVINLGASTITLSSNFATFIDGSANLTLNAGTSTIVLTGSSAALNNSGTSPVTFANVSFTNTSTGTRRVTGLHSFNNLTVSGPASAGVVQLTFDSRQTINGTLSTTGTAGNRRVWFQGLTYGIAQTLTINATPSLTDADFRDIYVVGTAAPISGTRISDLRGCRGITFSTPKTVYWNSAAGGNWSANAWAASSGGAVSTDNFPLAQDTATIQNTGLNTSATITFDGAISYFGSIDFSSRTNAMTFSMSFGPTIYGNITLGSGVTTTGGSGLVFSGRNTQTITSNGRTLGGGSININSYGGTLELADALNLGSNQITVTNGTFDTKNYNVTALSLTSNNANVRTVKLGSSTLSLTGTIGVNVSDTTNLTFDAGTSQININALATITVITSGGVTFNNVTLTNTSNITQTISGNNTFNNLTITATAATGIIPLVFSGNQTITGTLTVAGASPIRRIFVRSNTLGTTRTLTVGTLSATDCDFRDITIAGAAAGSSPTRAGDCGGNSGITFPAPKTVYWNLAGAQNWSATAWAPGSGGTPDINNFPLAQDTAVFDNTGSVGTVTTDASWALPTINMSARTSAMTFSIGTVNPIFIYGDFTFGTGVTTLDSSGILRFGKRGVQTITSNGRQFNFDVYVDSVTGTVQLADAIVNGSGRQIGLTSGTFDAVSYNVTTGFVNFSGSTTRTFKMGSGTWTVSGTLAIWEATTTTNLAFYKGTANIVLSDTSTSARTFNGGALSYNKLTIGGATGTSTLTITGDNQFTELASTKTVAHTIALGSTTQTFGKWTVTGTAGNVVTLTGTGTSHVLAGACTSGIDYLAMGSIGFSSNSPGEFYAGANSTGTAGAPVYRTAKPADSTRYWVGGTGNWSDTNRWSTGSGGAGGASVPRSHDDVVFDSLSNATAYTATVDAVTGGIRTKSLTIAGPASGNVTLAGTAAMVGIHGNVTFPATGLTRNWTGDFVLSGSSTGLTVTTNGVSLFQNVIVNGVNCEWTLGSAFSTSLGNFTVTNGSIDFATYNFTNSSAGIVSNNANSRTIKFGTGTVALNSANQAINFGTTETNRANLTFNANTSQLTCGGTIVTFSGNNQTFYNVSFTSTSAGSVTIEGANSFNNLSFTGITSIAFKSLVLAANQTITGTLTFSAGTNATMRHFVQSNTFGTTRTLTVAAFSGTDVDFRDVTVTGAAAPISGTRLGDCKGNSGITFVAGKTVYVRSTGNANWSSSTGWAATSGGTADVTQFPLAQDTVIFPAATYPASGSTITIDQSYNIGTIDMSLRTGNTVTLATSFYEPTIYGNWINGTGTTLTGTGILRFSGRGSQTITSAGKTFPQPFTISSIGGTVTLQDSFITSNGGDFSLTAGTFDLNNYNFTSSGSFRTSGSLTRNLAFGSGTLSLGGSGPVWSVSVTNAITGTGTISLTSASAKTFAGGGDAYSNITLNQGGAGTLTINSNNTFKDITNTYKATGATNITLGTTTQRVSQFTAAGEAGRLLTIQGTSATSPATLVFTGSGTAANVDYLVITGVRAYNLSTTWYAGTNSTNNGSLGWIFDSGTVAINSAFSDTATGSDSVAAVLIFGSAISETATALDTLTTIATLNISIDESATAADSVSSSFVYVGAIDESATGSDTTSVTLTLSPAVAETVAISDEISTLATLTALTAESAVAADTTSAFAIFAVSLSETSTASDSIAATRLVFAAVVESATGTDTVSSLVVLLSSVDESAVALDSVSVAASIFNAPISESASGSDNVVSAALFATSISESATGTDSDVGFITFPASINETSTTSDALAAQAVFGSSIAESALALDAVAVAASVFNVVVPESAVAQDTINALAVFPASISETVTLLDLTGGAFLWNMVDDSQGAAWQNVNNSQGAGWTDVNNSQGSPWTPVLP